MKNKRLAFLELLYMHSIKLYLAFLGVYMLIIIGSCYMIEVQDYYFTRGLHQIFRENHFDGITTLAFFILIFILFKTAKKVNSKSGTVVLKRLGLNIYEMRLFSTLYYFALSLGFYFSVIISTLVSIKILEFKMGYPSGIEIFFYEGFFRTGFPYRVIPFGDPLKIAVNILILLGTSSIISSYSYTKASEQPNPMFGLFFFFVITVILSSGVGNVISFDLVFSMIMIFSFLYTVFKFLKNKDSLDFYGLEGGEIDEEA